MKIFVPIILILILHAPVCATNQWYDDEGNVYFTLVDPPADAKTKDGSMWWNTEIEEEDNEPIERGVQQVQLKIESDDAYEPVPGNHTPLHIEEDTYQKPKEEEPEADEEEGFSIPSFSLFKWWDSTRVDTNVSSGTLYDVWGSSKDDIFVVGTGEGIPLGNNRFRVTGGIFHYDGDKWSEMSSSEDEFLEGITIHAVWGSSSIDVYAVGSEWTILHYDGIEWRRVETDLFSDTRYNRGTGPGNGFTSVWGSSANDIYAVGSGGTRGGVALHFNGEYWRNIALPDNNRDHYYRVWGTSAENVFILGDWRVFHFNGSTWNAINIGKRAHLRALWGTSNNDVFAAGSEGKIFHYDGEEWSEMFGLMGIEFYDIWGSSNKNAYAAGYRVKDGAVHNDGVVYHYNGTQWKRIKTFNRYPLLGIWGHGDGDVFALGGGKSIFHYSGISIFTFAIGALAVGLGIFGWRFIQK